MSNNEWIAKFIQLQSDQLIINFKCNIGALDSIVGQLQNQNYMIELACNYCQCVLKVKW